MIDDSGKSPSAPNKSDADLPEKDHHIVRAAMRSPCSRVSHSNPKRNQRIRNKASRSSESASLVEVKYTKKLVFQDCDACLRCLEERLVHSHLYCLLNG